MKNRKIENRKKIGKNWKIGKKIEQTEKWENRNISKSGPNHGANECPKGEL